MSLYVIATIKCTPTGLTTVRAAMHDMVPASRQEPGCLRYDLLESAHDPHVLTVFETYASDAALEAHRTSVHYQAYRARVADSLAEPVKVELLYAVDAAG